MAQGTYLQWRALSSTPPGEPADSLLERALAALCVLASAQNPDGTDFTLVTSSTPGAAAPVANTAAVVTFGAVVGQQHRLTFLSYSVSGTPVAATTLTVTDGTTTYTWDVLAVAPGTNPATTISLPPGGVKFVVGAALTITLGALGAGISGRVNAAKVTA
jgi:hypothetical protein